MNPGAALGKTPVNEKPKRQALSPMRLVGSLGGMENQKRHMAAVH